MLCKLMGTQLGQIEVKIDGEITREERKREKEVKGKCKMWPRYGTRASHHELVSRWEAIFGQATIRF